MARVRSGELPWMSIDQLHRMILDALLVRFRIEGLTEDEVDHLNRVWHRLDPWPDARRGIALLKRRRVVATLSNGNVSLLVDMAKNAGLPWDTVLSGELIQKYKPDPEVYRMAARLLGAGTDETMLVAAHPDDLLGAQRAGLKTAYVPRPLEHGPKPLVPPPPGAKFDYTAADFLDLARQLGA